MLPFTGSIEFKLAIGAFGTRVIRHARIQYAYRPPWPYYDERAGAERSGDFVLDVDLSLLPRSKSGAKRMLHRPPKRRWEPASQLLAAGILSAQLRDAFRQRIDEAARAADQARRQQAGQATPPLPDTI
jgi:hypothetical protein